MQASSHSATIVPPPPPIRRLSVSPVALQQTSASTTRPRWRSERTKPAVLLKPGPSPKQQTVALKFYQPKAIKQRIENAPAWLVSMVMGLKSGEAAGLNVDSYVWPRVERYLDSVSTRPENDYYAAVGYSYKVGDIATPSMTAEGLLCRQYMGLPRNMPGMAQGLGALVQNHPINVRQSDVYYWYYATQSLHHYGGPLWTQWNDKMKVALPAEQELNGRERGSWSPQNDAWGRHAGRLYTTCFSLYCLEVYYRHMPLYASDLDAE